MDEHIYTDADFPFPKETDWAFVIDLELNGDHSDVLGHPALVRFDIRGRFRQPHAKVIRTPGARWWLQWSESDPETASEEGYAKAVDALLQDVEDGVKPRLWKSETYFAEITLREAFELSFISRLPAFVKWEGNTPRPDIPPE